MSADKRFSYEQWAVGRLRFGDKCTKGGGACIPLREDEICRKCFEAAKEAHEQNAGNKSD